MLLRYLKKSLVFSVVAVGIFTCVLSCDSPLNPFSSDLGKKVDIEPPTVTIKDPAVGAMLKGSPTFTGQATAYRKLNSVSYRILDPNDILKNGNPTRKVIKDWTSIPLRGREDNFKDWAFTLDTTKGFEDGFLKLQFKSDDGGEWSGRQNESVVSVFFVKNGPSIIKTNSPSTASLEAGNAEITTGLDLQGSIYDMRGIKPGYPKIKFWPDNIPEPDGDDPNWGWAILPLSAIGEDPDVPSSYIDRENYPVLQNETNFNFKLNQYTIDPTTRRLSYSAAALPSGDYNFRIITRETYFEENATRADGTKNPRYMFPCLPPSGDEDDEMVAHYPAMPDQPPEEVQQPRAEPYKVKLVNRGTRPDILIDNTDVTVPAPPQPHIYIEDLMSSKILTNSMPSARDLFRLRVKAKHDDVVDYAILEWSHNAGGQLRGAYLKWDAGGDGYVNGSGDANQAEFGHKGTDAGDGKYFVFTAKGSNTSPTAVPTPAGTKWINNPFTPSTQPYTLTVTVFYSGDGVSNVKSQYKVYLNGSGATVKISSVRGYSDYSSSCYTVNEYIQVALDIANAKEIKGQKWLIEQTDPANAASMKAKLDAFRAYPTDTNAISFFDNIPNGPQSINASAGRIIDPNDESALAEDKTYNIRANVGRWETEETPLGKKDIWLYAIVQDEMYNLGYVVQHMYVDNSTDKPTVKANDLMDEADLKTAFGVPANDPFPIEKLYVTQQVNRKNVISSGATIEMDFTDDDGIRPVYQSSIRPGGIVIKLTAHDSIVNNQKRTATIDGSTTTPVSIASIVGSNVGKDFNVFLSQGVMARVLGLRNDLTGPLPDGLYTVEISITDDRFSKVDIGDTLPPAAGPIVKTIHFAVHSNEGPEITIGKPGDSMLNKTKVDVGGKVTSRNRVQKLEITYTPDVVTPSHSPSAPRSLNLYATEPTVNPDGTVTGTPIGANWNTTGANFSAPGRDNATGLYTYYWVDPQISFDPYPSNDQYNSEDRRFTLVAYDGFAQTGDAEWQGKVDTTPPEVAFVQLNFGRLYYYNDGEFPTVNGKVPIEVSVTDANFVKLPINWFILSTDITPAQLASFAWDNVGNTNTGFTPGTTGRAGTLTAANSVGGGNYRFFINTVSGSNTTSLPDGDYNLYVYAKDDADNPYIPNPAQPLTTFTIKQESDYPNLHRDSIYPVPDGFIGLGRELVIRGRIFDDDGYSLNPSPARKYVRIRLRAADPADGVVKIWTNASTPRNWNGYTPDANGWFSIDAPRITIGAYAGYIEYSFNFGDPDGDGPLTAHPWFADGVKEYQIMALDEDATTPPNSNATTRPDPWGKNPDQLPGQVPLTAASPNPVAAQAVVYYPGADPLTNPNAPPSPNNPSNFWYKFTIKVKPPEIIFKPVPVNERVYRTANALFTAFNGGSIVDDSLRDATFLFQGRGQSRSLVLNKRWGEWADDYNTAAIGLHPDSAVENNVKSWTWNLYGPWLGDGDDPATTENELLIWNNAREGPNTIKIRATDTLLISGERDWEFVKDTEGPRLTFDNIRAKLVNGVYERDPANIRTVSIPESGGTIDGQFNDLYSNLGIVQSPLQSAESFEYKIYRSRPGQTAPTNWSTQLVTANGGSFIVVDPPDATNKKGAIWKVSIPGRYEDDGPYRIQLRVTDRLGNTTTTSTVAADAIEFIVDRKDPEMLVEVDNLRFINSAKTGAADTPLKDKDGVNKADGPLPENERVFTRETGAATDIVFTLSGLVYEHNLKELQVNFNSGSSKVDSLDKTVPNDSTIAWINGANATKLFYPSAASAFRIRQAKDTDLTGLNAAFPNRVDGSPTDPDYIYVWELDVFKSDFDAILAADAANADSDRISRAIAVNAYDTAGKNAGWQKWLFKLDNNGPEIEFTNLETDPAKKLTTLEEGTPVLRAQSRDAANIHAIQYKIEKWTGSGTWVKTGSKWHVTGTAPADWTDMTGGFKNYVSTPAWTVGTTVNLSITDSEAIPASSSDPATDGDGYYRVIIKTADSTLKTTNAPGASGNGTTTTAIEFFVDRKGPGITWLDEKSFAKWDSAGKITFAITAKDLNTIDTSIVGGGKLTNNAGDDMKAQVSYVVTGGDTNSASLAVTVSRDSETLATPDGKYTLTLNIYDKAGVQALANHATSFFMDTTAPTIAFETVVNDNVIKDAVDKTEAITGRVLFRGRFTKQAGRSPIERVAYAVTNNTMPTPTAFDDTTLKNAGWYFNSGNATDPWKMWLQDTPANTVGSNEPAAKTGKGLIEIDQGRDVANLKLYDTRRFVTYRNGPPVPVNPEVLGAGQSVTTTGKTITFGSTNLAGTETVHLLKIWLLVVDQAGNCAVQSFDRYVYPKGDIPTVTVSTPKEDGAAVDRRLNGSITLAGTAVDNYRIGRVWFRVLDNTNEASPTVMPLKVPKWDGGWNALPNTEQIPQNITPYEGTSSPGWYLANGSGSKEVSWWAQINTQGELDPLNLERPIIVQVIAEDMIFDDETGEDTVCYDNTDGWTSDVNNWFSALKPVKATVVSGAPVFTEEFVKSFASDQPTATTGWGSILTTNVRGRASYQVTVRHTSAVGAVRWTNAPSATGVKANDNIIDTTAGVVGTHGIQVKAEPKGPKTAITSGKWYLILTPYTGSTPPTGVPGATENARYTTFQAAANNTSLNGMTVLEAVDDVSPPVYEWLITIDLNTTGTGSLNISQGFYEVNLEAADNSKPVAITSRKVARIPIDNVAPTGLYSHSTNIAGSSPTFGGEANDAGTPSGLSRVVLWFSRSVAGVNRSIIWGNPSTAADQIGVPVLQPDSYNNFNGTTAGLPAGVSGTLLAGVTVPNFAFEDPANANFTSQDNYSYIVIDRQDPLGNQTHHGHKQKMGWATAAGGGNTWYVSLDSREIESGRVIAHYIVYDRAGNGRYYNQQLMILNSVPKITKITLATDLGTHNLHTAANPIGLGTGNGNLTFPTSDANGGAMARIRTAMGLPATARATAGISEEIAVDTSKEGVYSLVLDQKDFMVRNNMFAVRVETSEALSSSKARNYRVEYVSRFRRLIGFTGNDSLTAAPGASARGGIRAGKVYIIDDPGESFPWGIFGAAKLVPGEEYTRGSAFLAMVDCNQVDLGTTDAAELARNFGTPSVWELNGGHYRNTGITATNYLERNNVPSALSLPDVNYAIGASTSGTWADFVYRNNGTNAGAFSTTPDTAVETLIVDFNSNGGANLDALGRPLPYSYVVENNTTQAPNIAHSLFIVKVFDGPEYDLFGDFVLLSVRVNNNDKTPPYAQLYDFSPKTEGQDKVEALSPGSAGRIGENRTKGGLWDINDGSEIEKSGHLEPRKTTSLTNVEMGGPRTAGTLTRPRAASSAAAYFEVDTVSGEIIVRGYAEDNQRIARVDLQVFAEPYNQATATPLSTTTILTQSTKNFRNPLSSAQGDNVQFTQTFDLNRHRVEWAYLWPSDTIPGGANVVGNLNVRVRAYNANSAPAGVNNGSAIPANERLHTSTLIRHRDITTANRTAYDSFNAIIGAGDPGFPASGTVASEITGLRTPGPLLRYNEIRVNLRPYITGFLRNSGTDFAHNIRSRQGRYILRRGEIPVISGYNLGNSTGDTNFYLPGITERQATSGITTTTQRDNYVVNKTHRDPEKTPITNSIFTTRYRLLNAVIPNTATTGDGIIELSVNGYSAVNNPRQASNETAGGLYLRPMDSNSRPTVQPWNKEYDPAKDGSELWDDYIMVHIWRNDETTTGVDQGRFKKGAFSITYPSMSIDPASGTLWASHQEGGRKPTWDGGENIYPGGGAYISNNAAAADMPYNDPDNNFGGNNSNTDTGLRQIGSFSEHMTYTNIYVADNSRVWAIANSITKYNDADRWRWLPGMWLWGPVGTSYANNNGNPTISHFPRTRDTSFDGTDNYQRFRFPTEYNGAAMRTGMYAVESLWYNGSSNSRTVSTPLNAEQFHNPHIVANAANTHVHVSYYDSKDGSLKYRYNSVGSTGIVNSEASPRSWVNLDGGADVDDNADITSAPGRERAEERTESWRGNYGLERTKNPDGTADPPEVNTVATGERDYPYYQASSGRVSASSTVTIRTVHIQNGAYVKSTEPIYTLSNGTEIRPSSNGFVVTNPRKAGDTVNSGESLYRLYPVDDTRIKGGATRLNDRINAGRFNSIAVTGGGFPVIAYYDETNQKLKLAVSSVVAPTSAANWTIHDLGAIAGTGTGEYVSIQISGTTYHIAAMNAISKNVVYVSGAVGTAPTVANTTVQIVDSVGNVGTWCKLSLDSNGNPWIAYMDDGYRGSKDGAKVAYKDTSTFYKGAAGTTYAGQDVDLNSTNITGWEAMHVPTGFRVERNELGMERFPTIRIPTPAARPTGALNSFAAVGFLGEDYYRIAYYLE